MAKQTTKNDDQPMIRHIFSKERGRTDNGPAGEDVERCAYELYLARGRADGCALEDWSILSNINAHFVSHAVTRSCWETVKTTGVPRIMGLRIGWTWVSSRLIHPLLHS